MYIDKILNYIDFLANECYYNHGDIMKNLFEKYIRTDSILFKYAKGKSALIGKEFHGYHEIILFLGGKAKLITDTFQTDIYENTLIVIPKESYHQLIVLENEDNYHRCILNFRETATLLPLIESMWHSPKIINCNDFIANLFNRLIAATDKENNETLLEAITILVLNEINNSPCVATSIHNKAIALVLEYINNHIEEILSLEILSQKCNLSPSSLSHIFKKEMQISIHKYIIKKRLVLARSMILSGTPAYSACIDCGFTDYSGFYRQYKKAFGCSPSVEKTKFLM